MAMMLSMPITEQSCGTRQPSAIAAPAKPMASISLEQMVSGDGGEVYPDFTTVGTDSEKCGYIATKHLIELGHRRIAYVSEPRETVL